MSDSDGQDDDGKVFLSLELPLDLVMWIKGHGPDKGLGPDWEPRVEAILQRAMDEDRARGQAGQEASSMTKGERSASMDATGPLDATGSMNQAPLDRPDPSSAQLERESLFQRIKRERAEGQEIPAKDQDRTNGRER